MTISVDVHKRQINTFLYIYVCVQIEQVSQLSSLVESQLQYHRQAVQILDELSDKLRDRCVCEHMCRPFTACVFVLDSVERGNK